MNLKLGKHITCVPIIHGRSIFAREVRRIFLESRYRCVAVELPVSLGKTVIRAVSHLPLITAVVYRESNGRYCYVPVEPGEGIIEALRLGIEERSVVEFVDAEIEVFAESAPVLPDEYHINYTGLEEYYRQVVPLLPVTPGAGVQDRREIWMASQLRQLDQRFDSVLFVCGMAHLPGIQKHFAAKTRPVRTEKFDYSPRIYAVHSDSIYLLTGEIPYLTFLYEKSRYMINRQVFDKIAGLKELLLETRKEYCRDFPEEEERLAPGAMQTLLDYLRNLCMVRGNLTPGMYNLVVAAQGVGGGGFGARVVEMAKLYPYQDPLVQLPLIRIGLHRGWFEPAGEVNLENRLPGPPFSLKNLRLERRPRPEKQAKWKRHWGTHTECSWPEEDDRIENFTKHVRLRAFGSTGRGSGQNRRVPSQHQGRLGHTRNITTMA